MKFFLIALILVLSFTQKCSKPPGASGFTDTKYLGVWYEMGKYQTAGGAYFEKDCTCT